MKILKSLAFWLIGIALSALVVIFGFATWVITNPEKAWTQIEKRFLPKDMKITWQEANLQSRLSKDLKIYLNWEFHNVLIEKQNPRLHVPIDQLKLEATLSLFAKEKIVVSNLQVFSEQASYFKPRQKISKEDRQNPFQQLQNAITKLEKVSGILRVENLEITLPHFILQGNDQKYTKFSIHVLQKDEIYPELRVLVRAQFSGKSVVEIATDSYLRIKNINSSEAVLTSDIEIDTEFVKAKQKLNLQYGNNKSIATLSGPVIYKNKKVNLTVESQLNMVLDENGAQINILADIYNFPGEAIKINNVKARIDSPFEHGITLSPKPTSIALSAPIQLSFIDEKIRRPLSKACQCEISEELLATLNARVWLSKLMSQPKNLTTVADLNFELEGVNNKLLFLNTKAQLKLEKKLNEFIFTPQIDLRAEVKSFQGLKSLLQSKNILMLAPLDVLEGSVKFAMNGPVTRDEDGLTFPAALTTKLSSEAQKADIEATSQFRLSRDFKSGELLIKAKINHLHLQLPPLDPVKGRPRIFADRRILKTPKETKKRKFKLLTSFEVETASPGAIRLLSEFFDPYLPITMNVKRTARENSGFVQTEPFTISYLRREVKVEKMNIDLSESKHKVFLVDGRLKVEQTQYTIFIDISGPANKPHITMSSDPYLPRAEIISVLLYDRTSEQLISADAATAGQVDAAVADRAIGLFSLWAFASTPIRSFSYNPITQVYTASIALSDDVTASIGTNWEETTQVELRKRVSRRWALTAAWTPADQEKEEITKLVLQWERRF